MAKKRRHQTPNKPKQSNENLTISDALGDDLIAKLKAAKKELTAAEQKKEEERHEQIRRERKEREKNKSFEELLEEYGDDGLKY